MKNEHLVDNCPTCARNSFSEFLATKDPEGIFAGILVLLQCNDCGLVFLRNAVKDERLYQTGYYKETPGFLNRLFDIGLGIFLSDRHRLVSQFAGKAGSILDVGCGDSSFLEWMKRKGWVVYGIDSSLAAVTLGKNKQIPVVATDLLDSNIRLKDIDVVTYWYSLEHLITPKEYIGKTYDILKKEGLLIVSVQNIGSLQFALCGSLWFHLDLPRHLLHFSPNTLKKLLDDTGFDCIEIRHDSLQMNFFGWFQSFYNLLGFPKNLLYKTMKRGSAWTVNNSLFLILILGIAPLVVILSLLFCIIEIALGRGGVITAIARKHVR